jgi:serine/threonine protein kinase
MNGAQETMTLQALVRERIDRWHEEGEPDAAVMLEEYPELRSRKSLVMDLALAEYSLRTETGSRIGREEFCDRFPTFRQSVARMLDVQDFLDKCPDAAAEEESARWPVLGAEFLGYELVEPLGRGGLARVYLARETKVGGRWVVVKLSRHGSHEAAALGKVAHPSVAPIHSVKHDAAGEWTLICMPLLGVATGIDLLDAAFAAGAERNGALVERVAVETKPLTPLEGSGFRVQGLAETRSEVGGQRSEFEDLSYGEAVARMGLQLGEGLQAAHAAGIMHRDIKPSNILLAWSGRAMLVDFNLATDAGAATGGFGGTPAYMAPEILASVVDGRGEDARHFDPRCDVYSLGAVLYELLVGRLPAAPMNAEKLSPVAYRPWLECKRASVEVPADAGIDSRLMAIVLKCLEFDPAGRLGSAAEVAEALRAFLDHAARPRRTRKVRRRAVLAAAVMLLVIGGGAWAYVGSRPETVEQLYQRGLADYERGKYEEAVSTFTQCLERRSGWPDALFGRGQALLKLEKWNDARSDFMALKEADPAWASAFAGYCSLQTKDYSGAFGNFLDAHRRGLRNAPFLMNYARVEMVRQHHSEAVKRYSEILEVEPTNIEAIRSRALALHWMVVNDREKIPSEQAFQDLDAYRRLASGSFEPALLGAILYGEAARKNSAYQPQAISFLADALQKGMPAGVAELYPAQIKRQLPFVDGQLLMSARRDTGYRFRPGLEQPLPENANWSAFRTRFGTLRSGLALRQP